MKEAINRTLKTVHLILRYKYYDLIDIGKKKAEYRDNTPYWRKRILDKDFVTFHRGYTSETMTFRISVLIVGETQITIRLGERIEKEE